MPGALTVRIKVVDATVICGSKGGTVRRRHNPQVRWESEHPFTLEFFYVNEEGEKAAATPPRWPFKSPPMPPNGVVGPTRVFEATLLDEKEAEYGLYKYYVTVLTEPSALRLDPIIIMD